jgi:quercetin dioxygenase-like cupin family protein
MNTNLIIENKVKGLQVSKIFESKTTETLLITLEEGKTFPTHTSPKDAFLVVIEGFINFHIENKMIELERHEIYTFKKDVEHYVTANNNSKFLIIR